MRWLNVLVKNAEQAFDKNDLFYCYSPKLKKYLCNKNLSPIGRGQNQLTNKTYWLFIRSQELLDCLSEWELNAELGIKAIEQKNPDSFKGGEYVIE